jgi:tetratricopeptide (TPR) repeat protein
MRCRKAQRDISEYADGVLDAPRRVRLERHLGECAECRKLLDDFRTLSKAANRLDTPEPEDAVWLKIEARLSAGETRRAQPAAGRAFGWSPTFARLAATAALALFLVASGVFVGTRLGRKGAPMSPAERALYTLAKLDEAEGYYRQAIGALSEAFAAQKGGMVPQVADMFEKNLSVVDATIQACRQAVASEPEDLQARNYLLAAYMDKVSILDTALEFQRQNPGTASRGQSF